MVNDALRDQIRQQYDLGYERGDHPLSGMEQAMDELGDPHLAFRAVHVTGTKGAGSTADFTAQTLQRAGYRVGKFSGVSMDRGIRDKFRINGEPITEDAFLALAEDVVQTITTRDEWDVIVAMAIEWFARRNVDVAVFEAGVGGRWDSTNVIEGELNIVVNAAVVPEHDHLGNSPAEVAYRKAGIGEPNSVLVSNGSPAVNDTVASEAARLNAQHVVPDNPITFERNDDELTYRATYNNQTTDTPITAAYLCDNANTAVAGLQASDFNIPDQAVLDTLASFSVPGRAEFIHDEPTYLFDGAHNKYAAKNAVADILQRDDSRKILVFSAAKKRWDGMLPEITPYVDTTILTDADDEKTADPDIMVDSVHGDVDVRHDPEDALRRAEAIAEPEDTIVITGDFTILGALRPIVVNEHKT